MTDEQHALLKASDYIFDESGHRVVFRFGSRSLKKPYDTVTIEALK